MPYKQHERINQENFGYKSLRPKEIIMSEKKVQKIVKALQEEYTNQFSRGLDDSKLYNLSSGILVPEDLAEIILKTTEEGHNEYSSFFENRQERDSKMFHDPIKRRTVSVFQGTAQKVKLQNKILE